MGGRQVSIGLDIGGTKIAAGIMDEQGTILERSMVRTDTSGGGPAVLGQVIEVIGNLVDRINALGYGVVGLGIATPGIVDLRTGTVIYASNNIPGWTGMPIGQAVRERFGLPTWVDNDGNMALVGELQFGAARGADNVLMITLGTGVGGAVAINGQIVRGTHGAAGKFGHIPLSWGGPLCSCGRRGCVEAYVSGPSVVRSATSRFGFKGTAEDLVSQAEQGDSQAKQVLREAGIRLGFAIAAAVNLLDPGLCLVAGGLAAAGDLLLGPARRVMKAKCHPDIASRTRLEKALLGPDAGLLGAAYVPWRPRLLGADY